MNVLSAIWFAYWKGIREIFLVEWEDLALESGIQAKQSGSQKQLQSGIHVPLTKDPWEIQCLESGIHDVESRIQDGRGSLTWGEFSFPMSESWYKCRDTAPLSTACVLIQQLLHEPFFYGERGRIIFLHCLTLFVTTSYIQIYTKKLLLTKCFLSRSVSRIFLRTGCTTKECLNWLVKWTNHKSEYEEGFWLVNNIKWTAESTYHTYLLTLQNESRRSSRRGGEGAQPQHP